MRGRAARFALQRGLAGVLAADGGHALRRRAVTTRVVALGLAARRGGCLALRGRLEIDAGAPRLREPDRDGLLRRPRTVLAFADVLHLLAHELARLGRRGFALA